LSFALIFSHNIQGESSFFITEGFALYLFLPGLAAHWAGREIREPALMARHGGKI